MVPGDRRDRWPPDLLTDPRVVHYWDEKRFAGRFFGAKVTRMGPGIVEWDAWILYAPDATWQADSAPTSRLGWGRTIVETREELQQLLSSGGAEKGNQP